MNELRWREPSRLVEALIIYRDRTRSEGFRTIRGAEIIELERRYFTTAGGRLPYYKVERIEQAGQIRFERGPVDRRVSPTSNP
jgi:uncharacterized protein (UPF0248 family)